MADLYVVRRGPVRDDLAVVELVVTDTLPRQRLFSCPWSGGPLTPAMVLYAVRTLMEQGNGS